MPAKKGDDLGGIRTIEDLMMRCYISPDTGCWHWRLSMLDNAPRVHVVTREGERTIMRGRRAALYLQRGRDLPKGHVAYARLQCKAVDCVNPAHCMSGDRRAHGEYLRASGRVKGLPSMSAGSRRQWASRRKITDEMAREIRTSTESTYALAKRMGLSQFAVWSCRAGRSHRETMGAASVFSWRPSSEEAQA